MLSMGTGKKLIRFHIFGARVIWVETGVAFFPCFFQLSVTHFDSFFVTIILKAFPN